MIPDQGVAPVWCMPPPWGLGNHRDPRPGRCTGLGHAAPLGLGELS